MIVIVDITVTPGAVTLEAPEELDRFHLEVRPASAQPDDLPAVDAALRAAASGWTEGDHALVRADAIRRMAAGRVDERWRVGFLGMLGFAAGKRWVTEDGSIQAHIIWPAG